MSLLAQDQYQIDSTLVTPLENQILQEYAKLLALLQHLLSQIYKLKNLNSQQLSDNLRILETKLSLVFTLFKGSVYSLFLQTKMNMNNGNVNPHSEDNNNKDIEMQDGGEGNETSSSLGSNY